MTPRPRTRIGGLALGALLLTATGASSAADAAAARTTPTDPEVASARAGDPPGTTYLYRGTFTADVTHSLSVDWGGTDRVEREVSAKVTGTVPRLRVHQNGDTLNAGGPGTVTVTSGVGSETVRTDDGRLAVTCVTKGRTGTANGPVILGVAPDLTAKLLPFTLLSLPTKCSDNQGHTLPDGSFGYGPVWAGLEEPRSDNVGARSLSLRFRAALGTAPLTGATSCPGYIEGQTPRCSYVVAGTLELELLDKVSPAPPKPPKPKGATVSPGAKKVTAPVRCPKKCTITINLTPLRGGPTLTVPRLVRPRPGRVVRAEVSIPPRKRALVTRAGGVRVKLTYRMAGGAKRTEIRKARL